MARISSHLTVTLGIYYHPHKSPCPGQHSWWIWNTGSLTSMLPLCYAVFPKTQRFMKNIQSGVNVSDWKQLRIAISLAYGSAEVQFLCRSTLRKTEVWVVQIPHHFLTPPVLCPCYLVLRALSIKIIEDQVASRVVNLSSPLLSPSSK